MAVTVTATATTMGCVACVARLLTPRVVAARKWGPNDKQQSFVLVSMKIFVMDLKFDLIL